ncbi:MAG: aldolase catalytic domain-containing protein, partial [Lachnospiraceae bacterium]|nr:aldolase catalytic domain-containing protein [Lachnospiraceae bacterium]
MQDIKLLDCTLRDGGFLNSWNFGQGTMVNFFERSVSAGINYIEVGFLDEREPFDPDRTITPNSQGMDRLFAGLDHGNSKIFAMIDYGTCPLENISDAKDSVIDGIRVMIKKKTMIEAIDFCKALKTKGYLIGAQPVSVTGYTDDEMRELVKLMNELKPMAMYIVDTYGLLDRTHVLHIFELIDSLLDPEIAIGYHAHNNFQLAFSNSVALMEKEGNRTLVIDGSAFGIGKSAGNCPLELLTSYLNGHKNACYDTSQILEMIDTGVLKIYEENPWGYQMRYFLCASNDCHPKYPQYLLQKKTLSVRSINEILSKIEQKERLAFNQAYIEKLYLDYQSHEINDRGDIEKLQLLLEDKPVLVLGPGPSMGTEGEKVRDYIDKKAPAILSINYLPKGYDTDYLFLSNSKRYIQLSTKLSEGGQGGEGLKIIATSNVTPARGSFDFRVDYAGLI